ncbi:MAG: tRNA 2-selenouridine(34) synthase MnmH [Bacteriovoracaceae bacterium]
MSSWNDEELRKLFLNRTPLIDVRSEGEFADGSIPFSVNMPIMNNFERAAVGTCYKEKGQEAAIKLGHELVSGKIKEERIEKWRDYIRKNPSTEVFCFRGGLRSEITCQWIDLGKKPIPGGYKRLRRFFLSWLDEAPLPDLIRIGGPTGSKKSDFIHIAGNIDLEALANHRGSAFGGLGPQPSQITFENELALKLMELEGKKILVEDESAVIGRVSLPKRFYQHLRSSPMYVLEVSIEDRAKNIFENYVKGRDSDFFLSALERIKKSLGGVNYQKIHEEMIRAFQGGEIFSNHEGWITMLLRDYYDPIYFRDLERQPGKIIGRGSPDSLKNAIHINIK